MAGCRTTRVLTLNLLHQPSSWPRRAPLVAQELCDRAPDIAFLQEVAWPDEQAHELAESLSRASSCAYDVRLSGLIRADGWQEGLAVLSRLPILSVESLETAGMARVCQRVRIDAGGKLLDCYNVHLDPHRTERRGAQAKAIAAWMEARPGAGGRLLAGDLNAIPDGGAVRILCRRLQSAYETVHGREPGHTFPTPLREQVRRRIGSMTYDYVLYSPESLIPVEAELAFTAPSPADPSLYPSDHYGVAATFEWRA